MPLLRKILFAIVLLFPAAERLAAQEPLDGPGPNSVPPLVLPGDDGSEWRHKWFATSDGVRLHYIEAGDAGAPTMVLIPGWTMPAAIWARQIAVFGKDYHVIAFDPRGQGDSEIAATGYDHARRTDDLADLLDWLGRDDRRPVALVAWSLGVLEALSYVATYGDARIQGLVLVDNSIGEGPDGVPLSAMRSAQRPARPALVRPAIRNGIACNRKFVVSMYARPRSPDYLDALAANCSRLPPAAASQLRRFDFHRSYWRNGLYATRKPILYMITPRFGVQASYLTAKHPAARSVVFADSGHAIFVDKADLFDKQLCEFIIHLGWGPACRDGSE